MATSILDQWVIKPSNKNIIIDLTQLLNVMKTKNLVCITSTNGKRSRMKIECYLCNY
jgi:hypothetical protein